MTIALIALKAAERSGDDAEIERGQWGVIDAASTLCQVTGGNIVELGNLMTAGLASYNTAVTNMATVIDANKALTRILDDPPTTPSTSDGTPDWLPYMWRLYVGRRRRPAGDLPAAIGGDGHVRRPTIQTVAASLVYLLLRQILQTLAPVAWDGGVVGHDLGAPLLGEAEWGPRGRLGPHTRLG